MNGELADASNDPLATGVYNASTTADFLVAQSSATGSPYAGSVDEAAFYNTELSLEQIRSHFTTATTGAAGAYQSLVRSDGALLQLSNNPVPEPSAMMLLGAGALLLLRRRGSRRR